MARIHPYGRVQPAGKGNSKRAAPASNPKRRSNRWRRKTPKTGSRRALRRLLPRIRWNQRPENRNQSWQVRSNDSPHDVEAYVAIAVDQSMPHASDLTPRHLRMGVAEVSRHFTGGFSDDLQ